MNIRIGLNEFIVLNIATIGLPYATLPHGRSCNMHRQQTDTGKVQGFSPENCSH